MEFDEEIMSIREEILAQTEDSPPKSYNEKYFCFFWWHGASFKEAWNCLFLHLCILCQTQGPTASKIGLFFISFINSLLFYSWNVLSLQLWQSLQILKWKLIHVVHLNHVKRVETYKFLFTTLVITYSPTSQVFLGILSIMNSYIFLQM